jgi:S1-C subfamily serine protease
LIIVHKGGSVAHAAGATQRLALEHVRLGRAPGNDVVFDAERDRAVSSNHAEAWSHLGEVRLRDLGSVNGTFVNGVRLTTDVSLRPGDVVRFGEAGPELEIRLEAVSPVASTVATGPATGPLKVGIGEQTLARAITKATETERGRTQRALGLLGLVVAVGVIGAGLVWKAHQDEVQRKNEEEARRLATAVEETAATSAEARQLAADAKAASDKGLEEALSRVDKELAGLRGQIGAGEGRAARLMAELEQRDRALRRLEERQDLSEADRAAMAEEARKRIADLQQDLTRETEALREEAKKGQGGARWEELVAKLEAGMFLVIGHDPQKGTVGNGTAFALREDGLLATNAHVVKLLEEMPMTFCVQNTTGKVFPIKRVRAHPGFTTPMSPDVGLIQLDNQGVRFPAFPLATEDELKRVRIGTQLGTLGYPGELIGDYLAGFKGMTVPVLTAQATFKDGWIGRLLGYDGERRGHAHDVVLQHSASLSGGTSGSPMLDASGKVVAINNSGLDKFVVTQAQPGAQSVERTPSAAELGYAIRADVLSAFVRETGW